MASENSRALSLDAHVKRINSQDKVATGILTVIVGLVMLLVVAIIVYILARGAGRALTPGFLTNPYNDDVAPGILYQLWDSFYMLIVTLVISVPISLGAAIFLVEYAPDNWVTSAAKTAIETLSSLPSIVVGMFGSLFFVVTLGWGISILAGACALTMFNIPILCAPYSRRSRTSRAASATRPSPWASPAGRPRSTSFSPRPCPRS